jgi:hypothetical protein
MVNQNKTTPKNKSEWIQDHPSFKYIGGIITVVGITYSIINYYNQQRMTELSNKYELELLNCKSEVASIQRGIKDNDKFIFFYDNIFTNKNSNIDISTHKYYIKDEFYTQLDSSYWKTNIENESRMFNFQTIKDDGSISQEFSDVVKKNVGNLYFWVGKDAFRYSDLHLPGIGITTDNIYPYIVFQKTAFDKLGNIAYFKKEDTSNSINNPDEFLAEFKSTTFTTLIVNYIYQQMGTLEMYGKAKFELLDIKKENDFLYIKSLIVVENPKINNKVIDKFFIQNEFILLSTNSYLYGIVISYPKFDRLSTNPEITKWLNNLKIII